MKLTEVYQDIPSNLSLLSVTQGSIKGSDLTTQAIVIHHHLKTQLVSSHNRVTALGWHQITEHGPTHQLLPN